MTAPAPNPDDDAFVGDTPPPGSPPADPAPPADPSGDDSDDTTPPADLGDAGKRALDAMKARLKAERAARKAAETERDTLKVASNTDAAAQQTERIRQEAETAATKRANTRIIRSEVKAAATGKLSDPADALTFLDLEQFEVDENGEIDASDVASAIEDLIQRKPYLAAAKANRFQGTGDNGAATRKSAPKQVTETELAHMTAEQIDKARREGRLSTLLGSKT